jgi:hypothetical protein
MSNLEKAARLALDLCERIRDDKLWSLIELEEVYQTLLVALAKQQVEPGVEYANLHLQKEFLEHSKEAVLKQQEYYQQQIDKQADQELSFFAAHAMSAMLGRNSFDTEHLAEIAFDHAQAMIDYKNKLREPPNPRLWQCHCQQRNFDMTHCGNCGSLRNE